MTCVQLANKYATLTNKPIPASTDTVDNRSEWLLTRTYCCQGSDQIIDCDVSACAQKEEQVGNVTVKGVPLTIIREDGFLHYVNTIGLQCINKLTGIIDRTPVTDGQPYVPPGPTKGFPKTYCTSECMNTTNGSNTNCFQCIVAALNDPNNADDLKGVCPSVTAEEMAEAVTCQSCIGQRWSGLVKTTSSMVNGNLVYSQSFVESSFNNIWTCITGENGLSPGAIAGIVIGCLAFVGIIVGFCVYWFVYRKRKLAKANANLNNSATLPTFNYNV